MERGNSAPAPGQACRPFVIGCVIGFVTLLLISGALELAHCATRTSAGGVPPSLPLVPASTERRLWLVLRVEDVAKRPVIPDMWPIRQDDQKSTPLTPGLLVLRMTCYADLTGERTTARTQNAADGCFAQVEEYCTRKRVGSITDVTFESREEDFPWVRKLMNNSQLALRENIKRHFFNFCQKPGPLDPIDAQPSCLGQVESKFHPAVEKLYQASNIELRPAEEGEDLFRHKQMIRPFCDGTVENVVGDIAITWKNASVTCSSQLGIIRDVKSIVSNARDRVEIKTQRSLQESLRLTGDCQLIPTSQKSCRIEIQHFEASRSEECKHPMILGLISVPELTTFLQPQPAETRNWVLTYILVERGLWWGKKTIYDLPRGRKHAVLTCAYGSDEEKFQRCIEQVKFYHDNAERIFVISNNTNLLGSFIYNDDKRNPSERARMKYILDAPWTEDAQRSDMSDLKVPAKASLWHSLRPFAARTFQVSIANSTNELKRFTCRGDLEIRFYLIQWKLLTLTRKKGGLKDRFENTSELITLRIGWASQTIVFPNYLMPADDVGEFLITYEEVPETQPESTLQQSTEGPVFPKIRRGVSQAVALLEKNLLVNSEGTRKNYFEMKGCFDDWDQTILFDATKITIKKTKSFDARSTALFHNLDIISPV